MFTYFILAITCSRRELLLRFLEDKAKTQKGHIVYVTSYSIFPSVFSLFHLAYCSQDSSMVLQ